MPITDNYLITEYISNFVVACNSYNKNNRDRHERKTGGGGGGGRWGLGGGGGRGGAGETTPLSPPTTFSKVTLGKPLRDGVECVIMGFPERTDIILN